MNKVSFFRDFSLHIASLGGAAKGSGCLSVGKCPSWRSLEMFRDHRNHLWMVCGNIMKYDISIWLSQFIVIYPSSWGMFTHVCQNLLVSHLATTHPQPWSVMSGFRRRIRRSIPFNIASYRARLAGLAVFWTLQVYNNGSFTPLNIFDDAESSKIRR